MVLGSCACCAGMLPFWVILCGICVALALWVGALYSDDLSEYKAPGCERWGEASVVLRGLPAASVLAFCLLVCYVWPG